MHADHVIGRPPERSLLPLLPVSDLSINPFSREIGAQTPLLTSLVSDAPNPPEAEEPEKKKRQYKDMEEKKHEDLHAKVDMNTVSLRRGGL